MISLGDIYPPTSRSAPSRMSFGRSVRMRLPSPSATPTRSNSSAAAFVCSPALALGKGRTPREGSGVPPYSKLRDFYDPPPWKPGQIGPVRLTTAEPRDNQARVPMYEGQTSYPYWHEPAAYFVSQPFSV